MRRRNIWPFTSSAEKKHRRVPGRKKLPAYLNEYRGYRILRLTDGDYVIPQLDRESHFDDLNEAKRFIRSYVKYNKNPTRKRKVKKVRNPGKIPKNKWVKVKAVKHSSDGSIQVMK
jgi:hypothetical protein